MREARCVNPGLFGIRCGERFDAGLHHVLEEGPKAGAFPPGGHYFEDPADEEEE